MRTLCLVLVWSWSAVAYAGSIETILAPPPEPFDAGSEIVLTVYFHNNGNAPTSIELLRGVTCRIVSDGDIFSVQAEAEGIEANRIRTLQPQQFAQIRYVMRMPPRIDGVVHIDIPEFDTQPLMTTVRNTGDSFMEPTALPSQVPSSDSTIAAFETLYQPYLANISAYRPIYFLPGIDPEDSKFQVSFKYRFFDRDGLLAQKIPWMSGFHLGYTQTSFWDLQSESKPFEDTSYKPEIFHLTDNVLDAKNGRHGLFLQTGFQHESNGQGGVDSRSTNFLYVRPMFILYDKSSKLGFMVAPRIWTYAFNDDETNPDLSDYRGYFDLELKIGEADGWLLGSHFRWADKGASLLLDWTYPLHRFLGNSLNLYFQVQYVNALAESLLDYRERNEALRVGFAIVR